jgi:hypothetical protein
MSSVRRLLSVWSGEDVSTRLIVELVASAFSCSLVWRGELAGKEVYLPPPGLKGAQVMSALEPFLANNPDMAEGTSGDVLGATLRRAFSVRTAMTRPWSPIF